MFDKLKKLFVVEDPNAKKQEKVVEAKKTAAKSKVDRKAFEPSGDMSMDSSGVNAKVNPKFIDKLLKAIEKNNVKGFDYLEYKQTLQNLDKSMLEQTRYEAAFAMAKTMNVTTKQLQESAQFYIDVLKTEDQKFDDALRNQVNIQITQRKNDFKGLEEAIIQKEKQIAALQKEIMANKAKLKASNEELDVAKQKINRTKAEFDLSYQSVTKQIKEDLDKINRYLK